MSTQNVVNCGYSRLKNVFRQGINYSQYGDIVSGTKFPVVGNLPKDLLDIIISQNKTNKKNSIQFAQNIYNNTARVLSHRTDMIKQSSADMQIQSNNIIDTMLNLENNTAHKNSKFNFQFEQLLEKAQNIMSDGLKKIIPNIGDIKLSFVADGTYSSVFKSQITDKDGEKLITDKAIKCYHDKPDPWIEIDKKCAEYLSLHSSEEVLENNSQTKISVSAFENMKQRILNYINIMQEYGLEMLDFASKIHGAFAEANITEYIRNHSGHKLTYKDGIILPDMFVLSDKPYSVSEFADKTMKADKKFDFSRLGLFHSDLSTNEDNLINGICVDLGGIMSIPNLELFKKLLEKDSSHSLRYKYIEQARKSAITGDKEAISFLKQYKDRKIGFNDIEYKGLFPRHKTDIITEIVEKKI